jgi:hypothetical protein
LQAVDKLGHDQKRRRILPNKTLSDLGLDDDDDSPSMTPTAKCRICGVAIGSGMIHCDTCKEMIRTSSATTSEKPPTHRKTDAAKPSPPSFLYGIGRVLLIGFGVFFLMGIVAALLGPETESKPPKRELTYADSLQALVDDMDRHMKTDVYGQVTQKGSHAFVVLESDFFTRMDPKTQRFAIESVRDRWFHDCNGKNITFKTWNGTVVADF